MLVSSPIFALLDRASRAGAIGFGGLQVSLLDDYSRLAVLQILNFREHFKAVEGLYFDHIW